MPLLRPNDFSHSLFVVLKVFAPWEQPAALPAAGHENGCRTRSQSPRTLPALRFAGAQGWITSEAVGSGLASHCSGAAPVRQRESPLTLDPGRRDQRTPAAFRRSRVQRQRVRRCRKLRIVRSHVNVEAHSLRCSSSPNRTRCAGLRFGSGMRQGSAAPYDARTDLAASK